MLSKFECVVKIAFVSRPLETYQRATDAIGNGAKEGAAFDV
jgi:hypothetical protein